MHATENSPRHSKIDEGEIGTAKLERLPFHEDHVFLRATLQLFCEGFELINGLASYLFAQNEAV